MHLGTSECTIKMQMVEEQQQQQRRRRDNVAFHG